MFPPDYVPGTPPGYFGEADEPPVHNGGRCFWPCCPHFVRVWDDDVASNVILRHSVPGVVGYGPVYGSFSTAGQRTSLLVHPDGRFAYVNGYKYLGGIIDQSADDLVMCRSASGRRVWKAGLELDSYEPTTDVAIYSFFDFRARDEIVLTTDAAMYFFSWADGTLLRKWTNADVVPEPGFVITSFSLQYPLVLPNGEMYVYGTYGSGFTGRAGRLLRFDPTTAHFTWHSQSHGRIGALGSSSFDIIGSGKTVAYFPSLPLVSAPDYWEFIDTTTGVVTQATPGIDVFTIVKVIGGPDHFFSFEQPASVGGLKIKKRASGTGSVLWTWEAPEGLGNQVNGMVAAHPYAGGVIVALAMFEDPGLEYGTGSLNNIVHLMRLDENGEFVFARVWDARAFTAAFGMGVSDAGRLYAMGIPTRSSVNTNPLAGYF